LSFEPQPRRERSPVDEYAPHCSFPSALRNRHVKQFFLLDFVRLTGPSSYQDLLLLIDGLPHFRLVSLGWREKIRTLFRVDGCNAFLESDLKCRRFGKFSLCLDRLLLLPSDSFPDVEMLLRDSLFPGSPVLKQRPFFPPSIPRLVLL